MRIYARLGKVELGDGFPVRIVGVINVSPESFYKGSVARSLDEALAMAERMVDAGADIIDVGGMSTAPYLETWVPPSVEAERAVPVVREIKAALGVTVSIDTTRAYVAEKALSAGADVVNDVSMLSDPLMPSLVASTGAGLVICAREDYPPTRSQDSLIVEQLRKALLSCIEAGVKLDRVVVDPAIGFWRKQPIPWYERDLEALLSIPWLRKELGQPVLVGVSRKSFLGAITGKTSPEERLYASIACEALAAFIGADAVRTHNPAETRDAVKVAEALRGKMH